MGLISFALAACETQQDFGATEDYFRNSTGGGDATLADGNPNGNASSVNVPGGGSSSGGSSGGSSSGSNSGGFGNTTDINIITYGGSNVNINPCTANVNPLLNLPDNVIFELASARRLGQCVIQDSRNQPTHFCDFYVKSASIGSLGYNGYPKNPYSGDSTGCVVAPTLPKHMDTCWDGYTPSSMCTDDYIKNAANQVRQAIVDGVCGCNI